MSESAQNAWQCPTCGRHIPRTVEVCRCGSERRRLEALGYKFEATPAAAVPSRQAAGQPVQARPAVALAFKILLGLAVLAVGALMGRVAYAPPQPTRSNIQTLATLDEFTLKATQSANTVPAFLSSAGALGALAPSGAPEDEVRALDEAELRQGFCSPSVARLIRHEYPGYYDDWPDDKLEQTALEKHPEYANRVCMVSTRLNAGPGEIIKYELKPRSILGHAWAITQIVVVAGLFAFGCFTLHSRLTAGRLAP